MVVTTRQVTVQLGATWYPTTRQWTTPPRNNLHQGSTRVFTIITHRGYLCEDGLHGIGINPKLVSAQFAHLPTTPHSVLVAWHKHADELAHTQPRRSAHPRRRASEWQCSSATDNNDTQRTAHKTRQGMQIRAQATTTSLPTFSHMVRKHCSVSHVRSRTTRLLYISFTSTT